MSKNFEKKQEVVAEIREKFESAKGVVLVDYMGIDVEQATELRKNCREAGVDYKVYKNNLVKLAAEGTSFEAISKDLTGPNAIAFSYDDPAIPAKILKKAAEDYEKLEIKSGVVEGTYFDIDGIKAIADLPSREELIAQLLRTISVENFMGRFVRSIHSPVANFTYLLKNIADQKN